MWLLVADDSEVERELVSHLATSWGYEVVSAADGNEAWAALERRDAPSIAILDWNMPGPDGLELCRRIRARRTVPETYVLILTGRAGDEQIVAGLKAGADDYLIKPFTPEVLKWRLEAGRRMVKTQADLAESRDQYQSLATHDPLTTLWNRGAILDFLHQELARAARTEAPVAVIMVDLDHFKRINDTWGHAAGDLVLRETSTRIRSVLRDYDSLGRVGGEEFLVVAPNCDAEKAVQLAQRIQASVAQGPLSHNGHSITVTASLGVAATFAPRPEKIDALIAEADAALYRAKHAGRNRVESAVR